MTKIIKLGVSAFAKLFNIHQAGMIGEQAYRQPTSRLHLCNFATICHG